MKSIKLFLLLIFSIIVFSGCLKVDTKIKLNKDGSGTIEENVLMSDAVVAMMNEFMSSFQDSSTAPEEFKLFKEDELIGKSSDYGEGVEYVSGKELIINGWNGYKAVYSFKDINQVEIETDPNTKIESGTLDEKEHFSFHFIPGKIAELIIDRPELVREDMDVNANVDEGNGQPDDKFIKLLEGMEMKISLEFNSVIIETNAEYVDDKEITMFEIKFSKLLKNKRSLEMLKNNPPESLDDMKALVDKIPEIKIDTQRKIFVKF
jgi:hypothetical protein